MNKAQYEAALSIINADCDGRGYLLDAGRACAVGGLLRGAGVPDEDLEGRIYPTGSQFDILGQVYGLEADDIDTLTEVNDGVWMRLERRLVVGRALTAIYEESHE